ncbi:hypothetical protein V6N11_056770 [Hibiscus sabdariffa]|uniref:Uncharacterized protein n=1 Tax=Hibiscus sabdariffa TaxID=183260 RepID=A0ABR2T5B1_9ROSI
MHEVVGCGLILNSAKKLIYRSPVLNGIVDALKDYIQGMGGVGKMTGFRQLLHGFSSKWICLKMASERVLLYRSDEHISSRIDEGQMEEQRIRCRGHKIKEPSGHIHYCLQLADFYNASFLRGYKIGPALIAEGSTRQEFVYAARAYILQLIDGGLNYERSEQAVRYGWLSNFNAIVSMVKVVLSDVNRRSSDTCGIFTCWKMET